MTQTKVQVASAGGKARAAALSPERRREIALLAASSRTRVGRRSKADTLKVRQDKIMEQIERLVDDHNDLTEKLMDMGVFQRRVLEVVGWRTTGPGKLEGMLTFYSSTDTTVSME